MHKLYKDRQKQQTGVTLWRNPTDRTLGIRWMGDGGRWTKTTVEPGATCEFPAKWPDKSIHTLCKHLVRADAPAATMPAPAPVLEPPPAPTGPLGDPGAVQSAEDRSDGKEASHTSGDALEKYAQSLMMQHTKEQLRETAREMGVTHYGTKEEIARSIAAGSVD
jgi:hypothetical protein